MSLYLSSRERVEMLLAKIRRSNTKLVKIQDPAPMIIKMPSSNTEAKTSQSMASVQEYN